MIEILYRLKHRLDSDFFFLLNKHRFKFVGKNVRIYGITQLNGIKNITLDNNVIIHKGAWLAALPLTGNNNVELYIGEGTSIGHYNHIYATSSIIIEPYVLTADKVYISDNQHSYEDISTPIIKQSIKQCNTVVIGEGSWLGENVCVIGASIGKHCVIGANSVVTHDIPDYCIAVGSPAKIIKKYNATTQLWEKVK